MDGYTIWQLAMLGLATVYAICGIIFAAKGKKRDNNK